jgi:ribose transport system substrate-binding protein
LKRKYFRVIFSLLFLSVLLLLLWFSFRFPQQQKMTGPFSVILYQYTDNDWTSLLDGIQQAEADEGVVINYVTMVLNGTPENELELIHREIENGAQGLLLAPVDSESLSEEVSKISQDLPILTIETGLGSADADISADNYGMGFLLGTQVAEEMNATGETSVCVIREYTQRQSVTARYEGFTDAIRSAVPDAQITDYSRSAGDYNLPVCITNLYANADEGLFVAALDKYCTEALIEAAGSATLDRNRQALFCARAFGIGNTEKTVSGLDSGSIRGLVYQNEFNMGYQALQALIEMSGSKKTVPDAEISYYYVTRETLYEETNQRLLFPLT